MVHVTVSSQMAARWRMKSLGAFHYPKVSGNFGQKSNGNVRFGSFRPEYLGPALNVIGPKFD